MTSDQARRAVLVFLTLVVAVLGFARLADCELRRSTKAVEHKTETHRIQALSVPARAAGAPGTPGGPALVYVEYVAPRPPLPRPASSGTPASRPMGADALGTSLPKRLRWMALGGHGRNGAG